MFLVGLVRSSLPKIPSLPGNFGEKRVFLPNKGHGVAVHFLPRVRMNREKATSPRKSLTSLLDTMVHSFPNNNKRKICPTTFYLPHHLFVPPRFFFPFLFLFTFYLSFFCLIYLFKAFFLTQIFSHLFFFIFPTFLSLFFTPFLSFSFILFLSPSIFFFFNQ